MISKEIIIRCSNELKKADAILIGAGAGLSASSGLLYSGKRFTDHFPEYINRYGLTDMYSSAFFPFPTLEEKWGYFSKHIKLNRYDAPVGKVYQQLLDLVKDRDYFIITTNADGLFIKTGFETDRLFATQGDYSEFQCETPCHDKLYDNRSMINAMVEEQRDCRIPSELIPKCPRCNGNLVPHLRIDSSFVENAYWHESKKKYTDFIESLGNKRLLLMELGVGFNTPGIIRFPFEQLTAIRNNTILLRVNTDDVSNRFPLDEKSLLVQDDIAAFFEVVIHS